MAAFYLFKKKTDHERQTEDDTSCFVIFAIFQRLLELLIYRSKSIHVLIFIIKTVYKIFIATRIIFVLLLFYFIPIK